MITLTQRRPLAAFYIIAVAIASCVVAYSLWVLAADADAAAAFTQLGGDIKHAGGYVSIPWIVHFARREPILFGIIVFAAAPAIAALIVALLSGRLKRLGRSLRLWNGPLRARAAFTYGLIFAIYAGGLALFSWMTWLSGGQPALRAAWSALGSVFGGAALTGAVAALFLDEGATLEELGWRGFVQDLLNDHYGPIALSLIMGALWWAWHLPREAITLLSGAPLGAFAWGQAVFLLLCIALSILATAAWNGVGGSVWVGVFIHAGTNVWSKAFGEGAQTFFGSISARIHPLLAAVDLRTAIVVALAAAIVLVLGPRLGRPQASAP